ncbi:hypothetical protein B0G76_2527 [Paraburkholderia sp. BL23I1N1]|nr:hypothetical protein B0G76_2527 [Paraburkholderia sp. BL23I1N1]
MNKLARPLRVQIDKRLTPVPATPVRVTRLRAGPGGTRCVRVDALRREGAVALLFFRHDDGAWRVFPPDVQRPAMRVYVRAA